MSDVADLDAVTAAIESGAGLPEVVRAAARTLEASLAVTDAWGATLAVAARSPAEERSLLSGGQGVSSVPLRLADSVVGALHIRARRQPGASMRRLLATMIASEVERIRAPERVSESAAADFLRAVLSRELPDREAGTRSRSAAAASPRTPPSSRAPPARRCSPPTSHRGEATASRSPSSRPAPTACCCRR